MSSLPKNDLVAACIREVEASHEFFVRWFHAQAEPAEFERWQRSTSPEFRLTTPGGEMLDQPAILDWIQGAFGTGTPGFTIAIEDPEAVFVSAEACLLIYIERQYRDGRTTRRRSMALFLRDDEAPRGVVWRHLQETWMQAD